ncbi:MAG: hypothetical protein LBH49_01195 [Puniceicoccales bacterium]|jgi:hypothetical protein|nr:hypothetical protein [Puniceicoccales bacterium]
MKNLMISRFWAIFFAMWVLFIGFGASNELAAVTASRPNVAAVNKWTRNSNGTGNSLIVNDLILHNVSDHGLFSGYWAIAIGLNHGRDCSIFDAYKIRKYIHKNLDDKHDCTEDTMLQNYKCSDIAKAIKRTIVICGFNDINFSNNDKFAEVFLSNGNSYYCVMNGANGVIHINDCNKLRIKNKKCSQGEKIKGRDGVSITAKVLEAVSSKDAIFLYENQNGSYSVALWRDSNVPTVQPAANPVSNPAVGLATSSTTTDSMANPVHNNNSLAKGYGRRNRFGRRGRRWRRNNVAAQTSRNGRKLNKRQARNKKLSIDMKNMSISKMGHIKNKRS